MKVRALFVPVAMTAALLSGCATSTKLTSTPDKPGGTSSSTKGATSAPAKAAAAHVGDTITLKGEADGEKIAVTLVKVITTAKSGNQYETPDKGKRYYAAQFIIKNVGTAPYDDSPTNGAVAVDSEGQQFESTFISDLAGGAPFPGSVKIKTGDKAKGYIVYEVPKKAKIVALQFGQDSGFGDTGEWKLS